jgi:hypothetical protein
MDILTGTLALALEIVSAVIFGAGIAVETLGKWAKLAGEFLGSTADGLRARH